MHICGITVSNVQRKSSKEDEEEDVGDAEGMWW